MGHGVKDDALVPGRPPCLMPRARCRYAAASIFSPASMTSSIVPL